MVRYDCTNCSFTPRLWPTLHRTLSWVFDPGLCVQIRGLGPELWIQVLVLGTGSWVLLQSPESSIENWGWCLSKSIKWFCLKFTQFNVEKVVSIHYLHQNPQQYGGNQAKLISYFRYKISLNLTNLNQLRARRLSVIFFLD